MTFQMFYFLSLKICVLQEKYRTGSQFSPLVDDERTVRPPPLPPDECIRLEENRRNTTKGQNGMHQSENPPRPINFPLIILYYYQCIPFSPLFHHILIRKRFFPFVTWNQPTGSWVGGGGNYQHFHIHRLLIQK